MVTECLLTLLHNSSRNDQHPKNWGQTLFLPLSPALKQNRIPNEKARLETVSCLVLPPNSTTYYLSWTTFKTYIATAEFKLTINQLTIIELNEDRLTENWIQSSCFHPHASNFNATTSEYRKAAELHNRDTHHKPKPEQCSHAVIIQLLA